MRVELKEAKILPNNKDCLQIFKKNYYYYYYYFYYYQKNILKAILVVWQDLCFPELHSHWSKTGWDPSSLRRISNGYPGDFWFYGPAIPSYCVPVLSGTKIPEPIFVPIQEYIREEKLSKVVFQRRVHCHAVFLSSTCITFISDAGPATGWKFCSLCNAQIFTDRLDISQACVWNSGRMGVLLWDIEWMQTSSRSDLRSAASRACCDGLACLFHTHAQCKIPTSRGTGFDHDRQTKRQSDGSTPDR